MNSNKTSTDSITGNFLQNTTLLNSTINDISAKNLTVANLTLADEATKNSLAQQLCDVLNACVLAALTKSNIADLKLTDATLINPIINKSLKLDDDALASLLKQLNGAKLESLTLLRSTLESPSIQDSITLDPNALSALMQQLKEPLDDQIIPLIQKVLMDEPVINKPTISGGLLSENALITSSEISNNTGKNNAFSVTQLIEETNIEGHLTLDTIALTDLCTQLSPCIQNNIQDKVDNYLSTTSVLPKNMAGCDGNPLKPTDKIPTCDVVDEKIKKATVANPQIITNLTGCDGNPLKLTDKIATCEHVQETVKKIEIKSITDVAYDNVKKTMTLTVTYTSGDKTPLTVDMSHMQMGADGDTGLTSGGKAPATTSGMEVPTTFFGGRAMLLGTPDAWFTAGDYVIPAFKKA
ncbi:hypothetical protein [Xenorhabdus thailandensis]|uniref:hypothetical protein n=1 Tax=Xenorhabdus thailandensis TaxID=3136255 RepID=UPI0030F49DF2